jgi:hypothetical protein
LGVDALICHFRQCSAKMALFLKNIDMIQILQELHSCIVNKKSPIFSPDLLGEILKNRDIVLRFAIFNVAPEAGERLKVDLPEAGMNFD